MTARVLVAGVGNVLLGDDGFGVEVVRRLVAVPPGDDVRVADFGIRGLHLAYELLEPYERVVLVDAMARGAAAGTLVVLDPEVEQMPDHGLPDAHGLDPASVLRLARGLGANLERVRVVGCEPAEIGEGIGLSAPVTRAVDEAVRLVRELVDQSWSNGGYR